MKTSKLDTPLKGMTIFSPSSRLMAEVFSVRGPQDFSFHVMNGHWMGDVKDGSMIIHAPDGPNERLFENDFVRVNEVTKSEVSQWYMMDARFRNFDTAGGLLRRPLLDETVAENAKQDDVNDITRKLGNMKTEAELTFTGLEAEDDDRSEMIDQLIISSRRVHKIAGPEKHDEIEEPGF